MVHGVHVVVILNLLDQRVQRLGDMIQLVRQPLLLFLPLERRPLLVFRLLVRVLLLLLVEIHNIIRSFLFRAGRIWNR